MEDRFHQVEQEYFRLRGQYAVGRIDQEQFDAALRSLAFQDEEGHFWMIGANSGRWYYSEGLDWFEAEPVQEDALLVDSDAAMPGQAAPANEWQSSAHETITTPTTEESETPVSPARAAVPFLLLAMFLLFAAGLAYFLLSGTQNLFAGAATGPTPTRISALAPAANPNRSGSIALAPTQTPSPRSSPEAGASPIPVTETPGLVLEPTDTGPSLATIPTITPGAPETPGDDSGYLSEEGLPVNEVNVGGLAPDVYVTGIRVSPNPPHQREDITFTASFLNTNAQTVGMEWRVVFLDPGKQGRNKDWGQSQTVGINVPPGNSEFSLVYMPVTSHGPCVTLQVIPARRLDNDARHLLPNTNGAPLAQEVTFCS